MLFDFRNSKCRIQYNNEEYEKSLNFVPNWYTEILELADYDFAIRFSKLKMAVRNWKNFRNSICRIQYNNEEYEKSLNCVPNWYTEVLELADHDFAIRFSKLKMAVKNWKKLEID